MSAAAPGARAATLRAATPPPPAEEGGALDWLWGVLLGEFNRDPSAGQVVTGMLVTMVPGLDQVADVRDVTAVLYRLTKPENRRDPMEWVSLVLNLIGLVPTVGSAAKGVLQLVLLSLVRRSPLARADIFGLLRRLGRGDPAAFVANHLSASAIQRQADEWFGWVVPKVRSFFRLVEASRLLRPEVRAAAGRALVDLDTIAREAPQQIREAVRRLSEALQQAMGRGGSSGRARGTVSGSPARATAREADLPSVERPEGPRPGRSPVVGRTLSHIPTSGTRIVAHPERTTTILGRWKPDMELIKSEMQRADLNVGNEFGIAQSNPGGFNFLDIPQEIYEANQARFFELFNRPWLDAAIERNDVIVLATRPLEKGDLVHRTGEPAGSYGKEMNHLVRRNCKPVNLTDVEWSTIRSWFR
jgi:hypothetical protein